MHKLNQLMRLTVALTFHVGLIETHEKNNTASIDNVAVGAGRSHYQHCLLSTKICGATEN